MSLQNNLKFSLNFSWKIKEVLLSRRHRQKGSLLILFRHENLICSNMRKSLPAKRERETNHDAI